MRTLTQAEELHFKTKYDEANYQMASIQKGPGIYDFPINITCVIFGINADEKKRDHIISLLSKTKPHIRFQQAKRHLTEFRIEIVDL